MTTTTQQIYKTTINGKVFALYLCHNLPTTDPTPFNGIAVTNSEQAPVSGSSCILLCEEGMTFDDVWVTIANAIGNHGKPEKVADSFAMARFASAVTNTAEIFLGNPEVWAATLDYFKFDADRYFNGNAGR